MKEFDLFVYEPMNHCGWTGLIYPIKDVS